MDSEVYSRIRLPFLWGVVFHMALLFIGSMGGETSLNTMAEMLKYNNPFVYAFCWIPSICYLLCCLILVGIADGKEMFKFALILLVGVPLLAIFGVGLIWGLIAFMLAFVVLSAMGSTVWALIAIIWAPGLTIAILCFLGLTALSVAGSFMFSF